MKRAARWTLFLLAATLAPLPTPGADDLEPAWVGRWPRLRAGPVTGVAVRGSIVYCSTFGGLLAFDVAELTGNPLEPEPLDSLEVLEPLGDIGGLVLSGDHVYAAFGERLVVVDVSDPADLQLVGETTLPGVASDLCVSGQHVYLTGGRFSVLAVDVSDPSDPRTVGEYGGGGANRAIAVSDGYAYVADFNAFLRVVDVRDPRDPREVARVIEVSRPENVAVAGNLVFSGGGIVDVSNPLDPRVLSASGIRGGFHSGGYLFGTWVSDVSDPLSARIVAPFLDALGLARHEVEDIFVADETAYLATETGLLLVDVSDLRWPERVGDFGGGGLEALLVAGNVAFTLTESGVRTLKILDVSDPAAPQLLSETPGLREAASLFLSDGHLYVQTVDVLGGPHRTRLRVFDVSDPAAATEVGSAEIPDLPFPGRTSVANGFAYIVSPGHLPGFWTIDVRDPSAPRVVGARSLLGTDVCVSGSFAYVTGEGGFSVLDVSVPGEPRLVHRPVEIPGWRIAVSGSTVYTYTSRDLYVIDVTDPTAPEILGTQSVEVGSQESDEHWEFSVSGDRAYVAWGGNRLDVYDVSDPREPERIERYPLFGAALDVHVSGDLAFVATRFRGLEVIDTTLPATIPSVVGRHDTTLGVSDMFVLDGLAFIADGGRDGLHIFDVSDPTRPRRVGLLEGPGRATDVAVSDGHTYVTRSRGLFRSAWLEVVDASDPTAPRVVGRYETPAPWPVVAVADGLAYLDTGSGSGPYEVVDVSDPESPRRAGTTTGPVERPEFAATGYAYAAEERWPRAIVVIDESDPAAPEVVGRYASPNFGWFQPKFGVGDVLYLGDHRVGKGIEVVDVSRRASFQRVGGYENLDAPAGVFLAGGLAHVADRESGLHVIDVSEPTMPRRLGGVSTGGRAENVFVAGGLAHVASGEAGLQVVDVENPAAPRIVGSHDTSGYARDVVVSGGLAYVADETGMEVIDVRDPGRPESLGRTERDFGHGPGQGVASDISVSGGLAYVAGRQFQVIDVSDPVQPRQVRALFCVCYDSVAVFGHHAFVGGDNPSWVFDVRDPVRPRRVGSYQGYSDGNVVVSENRAYVVSRFRGLEVLDLSEPTEPRRVGGSPVLGAFWPTAVAVDGDGDRVVVLTRDPRGSLPGNLFVLEPHRPFPPVEVTARAADGEARLSWSEPAGGVPPAGYDVHRIQPGTRTRLNDEPVSGTSFIATGLENGVEHCFVVQSLSATGEASVDSAPSACVVPEGTAPVFLRGDCNDDGRVDISDAVEDFGFCFRGESIRCSAACDTDGDGNPCTGVTDGLRLLMYLFRGGEPPAPPFRECGTVEEEVDCAAQPVSCQ